MIDPSPNIPFGYAPGAPDPVAPFADPVITAVNWDDVRAAVAVAIPELARRIAALEAERAERLREEPYG